MLLNVDVQDGNTPRGSEQQRSAEARLVLPGSGVELLYPKVVKSGTSMSNNGEKHR